jgi:malate permease and related proteins
MTIPDMITALLPLYVAVAIGFAWARTGQPFDPHFLAEFIYLIGVPALILSALGGGELPPSTIAVMAGAALASVALCTLIGAAVVRATGSQWIDLPLIALPLAGAIGVTVAREHFGAEGYALAVACFAPIAMLAVSLGHAASRGAWRLPILAGSPALWVIAAAFAVALSGWIPPRWVGKTADIVGASVAPCLMLVIGVMLARTVLRPGAAMLFGLTRVGVGGIAGLVVASLFGLGPAASAVLVLQGAMPVELAWALSADPGAGAPRAGESMSWSLVFALIALPGIVLVL